MYHRQRDFIQLAENPTEPPLAVNDGAAVRHKSIFAVFLNALYESRRLKAASVIHQNRRLIAEMKANIINRTLTPTTAAAGFNGVTRAICPDIPTAKVSQKQTTHSLAEATTMIAGSEQNLDLDRHLIAGTPIGRLTIIRRAIASATSTCFGRILAALHDSRRKQAAVERARYRYLIHDPDTGACVGANPTA